MTDFRATGGSNCQRAVGDQATRVSLQNPTEGDKDALVMFQETIPAGSRLVLTYAVDQEWLIHVREIIVDFYVNTTYKFILRGQTYEGDNEAKFSVPQIERDEVNIIIENLNAAPITLSGRITAWASSRVR